MLTFVVTGGITRVWAQAREVDRLAAQQLAQRAIDALIEGEDATGVEAQRAAYRKGLALAQQAVAADTQNADGHFALFATSGRLALLNNPTPNPFELMRLNRELDRVLELDPNHPDALTAKGGIYRQLPRLLGGNISTAQAYLSRAIALDPDNVAARIELARVHRDAGQPERAVPLLREAAAIAIRRGRSRKADEIGQLLREMGAP